LTGEQRHRWVRLRRSARGLKRLSAHASLRLSRVARRTNRRRGGDSALHKRHALASDRLGKSKPDRPYDRTVEKHVNRLELGLASDNLIRHCLREHLGSPQKERRRRRLTSYSCVRIPCEAPRRRESETSWLPRRPWLRAPVASKNERSRSGARRTNLAYRDASSREGPDVIRRRREAR
jgi:hypothetical protein